MKAPLVGGLTIALALPAVLAAGLVSGAGRAAGAAPSAGALADIPAPLLARYRAAAALCPGLPWTVLAAIGKEETDHGRAGGAHVGVDGGVVPPIRGAILDGTAGTAVVRDSDGGRLDGDPVFDRALGPMQFLPATWSRWGRDASGDGVADVDNAYDAIASAAAYLCASAGRLTDVVAAVATYNRSAAYVERVLSRAAAYGSALGVGLAPAGPVPGGGGGLNLSAAARSDLAAGRVDERAVAVLGLVGGRFSVDVSVIRTGHSRCVGGGSGDTDRGCTVSAHWSGRAVDISAVNGEAVTSANRSAAALVEFLLTLPPPLRPDELGVPWAALAAIPGVFSDAGHQDHLHVAWPSPYGSEPPDPSDERRRPQ